LDKQPTPLRKHRDYGDDGIYWDKANKCYIGAISRGFDDEGKRIRLTVRGKTKEEVKGKLKKLHDELNAGIHTPAGYTVEECVREWLDDLVLDPDTIAEYRGQAEKWIYRKIGTIKLKDLTVADAERFFRQIAQHLSKRSLVMIKSTLRRSIRRAQKHDLIGKNIIDLVDLPEGQPGRPSRAMTEDQARKVLHAAASSDRGEYIKVIRIGAAKTAATHAATGDNQVACRNKPRKHVSVANLDTDLNHTTCRSCRACLGLDDTASDTLRLEALFVVAITLGLRPGELRALTWEHVKLDQGVIHIWHSARRDGDTKTPKSRRSLRLPGRAIQALIAHQKRQAQERLAAGPTWHEHNLVFCHQDGTQYTSDDLNYRFSKITIRAGIGHWHAHEGRHTAVSIMSHNGVPIQDIADAVGHKSTHVTETVYRHLIVPAIRGGATVMDSVFE